MTAEFPAIVRFNRALATTLLLSGGAIVMSSLLAFLSGHFPFGLVAGFVVGFGGITLRRHTYFRLDRRELVVYKPTGKEDYRCALTSIADLDLDTELGAVYLLSGGDRRKVPLYRWLAEAEDWDTFQQLVTPQSSAQSRVQSTANITDTKTKTIPDSDSTNDTNATTPED